MIYPLALRVPKFEKLMCRELGTQPGQLKFLILTNLVLTIQNFFIVLSGGFKQIKFEIYVEGVECCMSLWNSLVECR